MVVSDAADDIVGRALFNWNAHALVTWSECITSVGVGLDWSRNVWTRRSRVINGGWVTVRWSRWRIVSRRGRIV